MSATAPPDELQGAALARGYFGIDVPSAGAASKAL